MNRVQVLQALQALEVDELERWWALPDAPRDKPSEDDLNRRR